jgi:O-antigen ligase
LILAGPLRRGLLAAFVLGLGLSITLSETALAVLTIWWLWRLRDPAARAAARWPLWQPVLAFSAVTLFSAVLSGHAGSSLAASKGLLLVAALYVAADALPGTEAGHRFLAGLGVVATVAAVVGLLQVGLCPGPEPTLRWPAWLYHRCDRARGFFSIYMTLAGVLTLVLLAILPRLLSGERIRRWLAASWLVMLGGLVASYTRGAWIGFGVGLIAALPALRRGRWLLVGGIALVVLALVATPREALTGVAPLVELRARLLKAVNPQEPGVTERVYMWRSGLAMWREHPWLGIGPGEVKREFPSHALPEAVKKHTSHVHNTPLQILAERGLLGLAAWLWIWGAFYARGVAVWRRLPRAAVSERALVAGSLAAITGFLVAGLSEYNFGDSEVVMVAWTIAALPSVVSSAPAERPGSGA